MNAKKRRKERKKKAKPFTVAVPLSRILDCRLYNPKGWNDENPIQPTEAISSVPKAAE